MKLYFFNNQGIARNDPPPLIIKTMSGITLALEITLLPHSSRQYKKSHKSYTRKYLQSPLTKTITLKTLLVYLTDFI